MIVRAVLASVAFLASASIADAAARDVHDIRDFGAKPNDGVLDTDAINATLGVVLKHNSDQERARKELDGSSR